MPDQIEDRSVSADDARRMRDVEVSCLRLAAPGEPARPAEDIRSWFHHPPASERRRLWLAGDGDTAAWPTFRNDGSGTAHVMVAPGRRGTGLGSSLLASVVARARSEGTTVLLGLCDDDASVRFMTGRDARSVRSYVRQVLDLREAHAPEPSAGDLTVWWHAAPESLPASYASARNAINDAPADEADLREWTSEDVRDFERAAAARGLEMPVTVLLDGERVVAFTEVRVSSATGAVASTAETAVVPDHRGRGVAKRLKAASLRELSARRPDVRLVTTTNEATNAPMLAVNRAAGFVPVATRTQVRLDLV